MPKAKQPPLRKKCVYLVEDAEDGADGDPGVDVGGAIQRVEHGDVDDRRRVVRFGLRGTKKDGLHRFPLPKKNII